MSDPWLEGPVTSAAYGWRLERRDGVTLGFTSHDRDIELNGIVYAASPGMIPTSIVETIGLETGGLDVRGALASDAITEADILAGRWDGARLEIFLFDWQQTEVDRRVLASGDFGSITLTAGEFEVEFLGPATRLKNPVAPLTSPTCRAKFAANDCGLNPSRFRHEAVASSGASTTVILAAPPLPDMEHLIAGELRWLGGPDCGQRHQIFGVNGVQLEIYPPLPMPFTQIRRIELLEGCDKTIATCSARFANALNFRGEPYLPGNDLLTRYPGAN